MSIKITFMHYRNYITWTRVKLLVVFEEFYMVYIFWLLFSFHYYCQLGKSQVSSAISWFSKLIPIPVWIEVLVGFLSRYLWTIRASYPWYPPHFVFLAILNALLRKHISEAVLPGKSSKSWWKQTLCNLFKQLYLGFPSCFFTFLCFFLVFNNDPQALYANLKWISRINLSPARNCKNVLTISFVL